MGDEIKLTTGVISSKTGFQGYVSLYQISAPIQPGNSGGPLFDGDECLIGIVRAKHRGAENVSYAIKTSYLNNLVESASSASLLPTNNAVSGLPLSNKVKKLKNFVFMITCSNKLYATNLTYSNSSRPNQNQSSSGKKHNYPPISINSSTTLISVTLKPNETILTLSCKNNLPGGWMDIDRNAYIMANGRKYTLTKAEGIAYAPNKTHFSYQGETKTFKLHFKTIPMYTDTIDFIENTTSSWNLYGIILKNKK